jgi:peroxiredoxin
MNARSSTLKELNVRFLPISADHPKASAKLQDKLKTDFIYLSDPQLEITEHLNIKTSSHHPMARTYPIKQFMQPAVIIWDREGQSVFEWTIQPKLTNLFGAAKRMTVDEILAKAKEAL